MLVEITSGRLTFAQFSLQLRLPQWADTQKSKFNTNNLLDKFHSGMIREMEGFLFYSPYRYDSKRSTPAVVMALLRQTLTSFQMVWKYAHEREREMRESWMIGRLNMTKSMVPFFCTLNFELATFSTLSPCSGKWSASGAYDIGQFMHLTWQRESKVWVQGFFSDINLWNWWCWSFAVPNLVYKCRYLMGISGESFKKTARNSLAVG